MEDVNLSDFARKSLEEGRGEWWIVTEMASRWGVDETEGRAIVARVSPQVYRRFLRRRRVFLGIGGLLILLTPGPFLITMPDPTSTLDSVRPVLYTAGLAIVGGFLIAHGWPGLRRWKGGDPPTSLPGRMKAAGWRRPFGSD